MSSDYLILSIFLIFTAAALVSTLALQTRQSLLVAYIFVGVLLGPWGFKLIQDSNVIHQTGEIGIVFLLFLLGLHLHPQSLWQMLRKVTILTVVSSLLFYSLGLAVGLWLHYGWLASSVLGMAMMFSSTIIGLKLLPTTTLHHQHTGEVMIGVLLMQDLVAIIVLLLLNLSANGHLSLEDILLLVVSLPTLILTAFLMERFVLVKLIARFERIREYIFLVAISWCLGMAQLANFLGLSYEIGAFFAGVALAASPIANYIAESLKPLRDFFLVIFFFSIGASFNLSYLPRIIGPALVLSALCILVKPIVFKMLLKRTGESEQVSREVGVRLGQSSEFSILVGYLALSTQVIQLEANYLIQAMTIFTFIVSCYWITWRYPTPLAFNPKLQKD